MPKLSSLPGVRRLGDFATRDDVSRRAQLGWAVGVVVVVVALTVVLTVLYLRPPGRSEYRATMSETGGITTSTDVRVGGIPVGKVLDIHLGDNQVDVRFSVDSSIFLGDQTSLQVRMLTVVGGSYVAVIPAGDKPLGSTPIPVTRTAVPYSTAEVLDAAAGIASGVDSEQLRKTTTAATDALNGSPGALRGIIDSVQDLTDLVNRQQGQIKALARLGNEYSRAVVDRKDMLVQMIRRIDAVVPTLLGYKDRGIATYNALDTIVRSVGGLLGTPYTTRVRPLLEQLTGAAAQSKSVADRMDVAIRDLRTISDKLATIVSPTGVTTGVTGQAPSYCIPIAGRTC